MQAHVIGERARRNVIAAGGRAGDCKLDGLAAVEVFDRIGVRGRMRNGDGA